MTPRPRLLSMLAVIGPGLLVAATGVGAGDLATAAFTGSRLGAAILWAVILGAFLKFVLTEGLARWQLATGQTLLEGAVTRLGTTVRQIFFIYLILWSFFVGMAQISACGVTAHALIPVFDDPQQAKVMFGVIHSVLGVVLVRTGGYRLFEKIMAGCIAVMFVTVITTAIMVKPDWSVVARGMVWPTIPQWRDDGLVWTIALMGGVGGTLTVLCYGYWMREEGRTTTAALRTCRIDLAFGYVFTALFGIAMVIIAAGVNIEGSGAGLVVTLADSLEATIGPAGRWLFLIGAWAAVFSSLLGVWQAVPYVFADYWNLATRQSRDAKPALSPMVVDTNAPAYRLYLAALATVPMVGLFVSFREVQKYYAVIGALFIPMLALALLVMNGRSDWVGRAYRNRPLTSAVLIAALVLLLGAATVEVWQNWAG